jgi:hypothetical protein
LGGEGTPTIGGFAPAELGCVLRISNGSACRLIGDALDLRHRLRFIWAAALAGQVPGLPGAPDRCHHPPADVFPYAAAVSRRIDLDHTVPYLPKPGRGARPTQDRQPRTPHPLPSQVQNLRRLAGPTTRTRHLAVAITPPPGLPRQRQRHPSPARHRIRRSHLARREPAAGTGELTHPPIPCGHVCLSEWPALFVTRRSQVQPDHVHLSIDEAEGSLHCCGLQRPNPLPCGLSRNISRSISSVITRVVPAISRP